MITPEGYSNDPSIMPEGIVVTFGREMIAEKGGLLKFIRWFESVMSNEDDYWMHKCKNKPQYDDLVYVYVITCNRVYYRCYYGGYESGESEEFLLPDGPIEFITCQNCIVGSISEGITENHLPKLPVISSLYEVILKMDHDLFI